MDATSFIAYLMAAGSLGIIFGFKLGKTDQQINHAIDQALDGNWDDIDEWRK